MKRGRPRKEVDEAEMVSCALAGMPDREIAAHLGMDAHTFSRRLRENKGHLGGVLARARVKPTNAVAAALYQAAMAGDVRAQMYWLSRRGGEAWCEDPVDPGATYEVVIDMGEDTAELEARNAELESRIAELERLLLARDGD